MPLCALARSLLLTALLVSPASAQTPPEAAPPAASPADAAPPVAPSAPSPSPAAPRDPDFPPDGTAGFELLASVGYGASTGRTYGVELDAYAATFGIEPGYVFRNGIRLGAYFQYGLGRNELQGYDALVGADFELNADSSTLHAGLSLGYDLPFYWFVLRYTLNIGFTRLSWDFDYDRLFTLRGYVTDTGTQFGFHMAPGLTLLWRWRALEVGLGFDYFIQLEDRIPPGVVGKLLVGVRL